VKTTVIIGIGAVVSTLIIIQVLFLLFAAKPEMFVAVNNPAAVDSLKHRPVHDSLAASNLGNKNDSLVAKKLTDAEPAKHDEKKEIQNFKKVKEKKEEPKTIMPIVVTDSVNVKVQVKMLEAMGAEGAAKIMSTMNDKEVKAILQKLKKRTAAKILVSFDPNRAARLLR
jgi:flagellar motility protein MotE (MotC chaperone)